MKDREHVEAETVDHAGIAPRKPYEAPAVVESEPFENLAMMCAKGPGGGFSCGASPFSG